MALHGVGPTVIARLEALGFERLAQLRTQTADAVCAAVAAHMQNTCWRNSPQARAAVARAIDLARHTT